MALRSGEPAGVELDAAAAAEVAAYGIRPVEYLSPPTLPPDTSSGPAASDGAPAMASEGGEPAISEAPAPTAPATTAPPAPDRSNESANGYAYDLHNYLDHVTPILGAQMLAPGQAPYGGYEWVGPTTIAARAPITGLRPVIEQAITDVNDRRGDLTGQELESRIAKRLTELNDWDNLNRDTQAKMLLLSGINIEAMSKKEREHTVNHLLHSPLPFGDIDEVLTPDVTIDLGYTHTLDKAWTNVEHLGGGLFRVWMVSNNNNGSHTGHSLGSFKVQLPAGTSVRQAREIANRMVVNKNDNNRLLLDVAARNILYGQTPWLDFTQKPVTTTTPTTAPPPAPSSTAPAPTDPGTTATTAPPPEDTTPTTAPTSTEPTTTATAPPTTGSGGHDGH